MQRGTVLWALALIGIGVVLLLRNAGVIDPGLRVWPLVLLVLGAALLLARLATRWGRFGGGFVVPLVLVAIGGVLALRDAGAVSSDVSIWPAVLIAAGVGLLLESLPRRGRADRTAVRIPLDGAREARIVINHGAGRLRVTGGAGDALLEGTVVGDVDQSVRRSGSSVEVSLRQRWSGPWWPRSGALDWNLAVGGGIPLDLDLRSGADEAVLELGSVTLSSLSLETGASKTDVGLPAAGRFTVRIRAGAASVRLRVPAGLAVRIRSRTGLASLDVPPGLVRTEDGYEAAGFEDADDRTEIDIEGGAASFQIVPGEGG